MVSSDSPGWPHDISALTLRPAALASSTQRSLSASFARLSMLTRMRSWAASKPHSSQRKPARNIASACSLREQLGLDEAAQPEIGAEPRLQIGQAVHQLDEAFADVELVVIEHEAGVAVLDVQVLDLLQDRGGVAVADLPQALAVAAAAEAAAERTAELRDQARRAMAFDAVAVGLQVDQMARRHRAFGEHLVGQEQAALGIVAVDHLRRVVLERLEDRKLAVAAAQHVERRFELRRRAMAAAIGDAALALPVSSPNRPA